MRFLPEKRKQGSITSPKIGLDSSTLNQAAKEELKQEGVYPSLVLVENWAEEFRAE